jgi:hypothetical protein
MCLIASGDARVVKVLIFTLPSSTQSSSALLKRCISRTMSSTASPLTTRTSPMSGLFTPPSSCSSHWTYEGQAANSVTGGLLIQNANAGENDRPCYPPGFEGWGRAPSFIQVFNPGACPSGYTTANNNYDGQTTTAVCCLRYLLVSPLDHMAC